MPFDAVRAAQSILRAAHGGAKSESVLTHVEGVVVSVERGVVELRDTVVGGTRRLVAPPLIAERLKRSSGIVTLAVDAGDHIVTYIR